MKKSITLLIALMMPLFIFGQSYASLWKKVAEASEKDLPKTEYEVLQRIVKKAAKGKDYGQLLKAELLGAQVMAEISPDSLKPEMERIVARYEAAGDVVLKTVYQTVLYQIGEQNRGLGLDIKAPELTPELCEQLAQVKDKTYNPFVEKGIDADVFGNDMLSVIAYELDGSFKNVHAYYDKVGNRRAACITACQVYEYAKAEELDSVIKVYEDLPEAGELAMLRYQKISSSDKGARLAYIHEAMGKWDTWKRMKHTFINEEQRMINPQFNVAYEQQRVLPQQSQEVKLTEIRNVRSLTMKVYRTTLNGDFRETPNYPKGYEKVKPHLGEVISEQTRTYTGKAPYEFFDDKMTLEGLPVGVYMVEFLSDPGTGITRSLLYVTDVYIIAEPQPGKERMRYVVVSATTGQPIAGAHLRIRMYHSYKDYKDFDVTTDEQGEYIFKPDANTYSLEAWAYTDTDKAGEPLNDNSRYGSPDSNGSGKRICIYTDRAIYRPGQKVFASALVYQVTDGKDHQVIKSRDVHFVMRDANGKEVKEAYVKTDDYGVAATEFTLPESGLTGQFAILVDDQRHYIRVEEYKRPTFHVDFPEVKQAYAAGDTLTVKGEAKTFAGVPVQGAKVSYKVTRRVAFWWSSYNRYWEVGTLNYRSDGVEIYQGEATTGQDGSFEVTMPLEMPETSYPMFYHFEVSADVTDAAGETHNGRLSLPLGNRKKALSVELADKLLLDDKPNAIFHLTNAAGQQLDGMVQYRIDDGAWKKIKTSAPIAIADFQLKSGKHTLEGICEGDTVKRSFVLFSLDDTVPVTETDDWFYQSAQDFPNDGGPVTIQVGSSAENVHIVYSIFAGNRVIQRGSTDKSNELLNQKISYDEAYGNGLLLTYAWVKNGHCYTHQATIRRALPDKHLKLQWETFRDRLKPGQQEEWTLTVRDPEGKPVDAQMMATLYDQSLDMLAHHQWRLIPNIYLPLPSNYWGYLGNHQMRDYNSRSWSALKVKDLVFSTFDHDVYPSLYYRSFRRFGRGGVMAGKGLSRAVADDMMVMEEPPMMMKEVMMSNAAVADEAAAENDAKPTDEGETEDVQVRENLNETAFFYPQLTTNKEGVIALKFTLPESLTTWRFMGLAHTRDMYYGSIEGTTVAQKEVMIQPNVPRFLRDGDKGTIAARIFNTAEKTLAGQARLKLIDPETEAVVFEQSQPVTLKAGGTAAVTFDYTPDDSHSLLICQMTVSGKGFSDGEQHYLPILPSTERVTVTLPLTQHQPGTQTVDLQKLIPGDAKNSKVIFEYTNQPAWLMVQALPTVGTPCDDNAISQAASFYANSLGRYILAQNPQAKTAFELWKQEADANSLTSALAKNQELKDLVLNETPWVMDAERETDQKQRLGDFFDENLMQRRLQDAITKLSRLQRYDGSWAWWPEMPGSFYMTVAVSEMFVRLNAMAGVQSETNNMLTKAFGFMGQEIVEEVKEIKQRAKEDGIEPMFPSFKALEWLYLCTLDGRELPDDVEDANKYLMKLLKKDIKSQSIYEKALTAVVLSTPDPKRALEYAQSLKEWTVYREDMGRYYDTPRAGYSWYDYKIPTQTVAIEALQRLTPDDHQTIEEMQRWVLQQKRTQAWDTPINSVNAVYAFLQGANRLRLDADNAVVKVDGQPLELPKATAGLGYVKTPVSAASKEIAIEKTSEGTSWGAVYAQFTQATSHIADNSSGIVVKREVLTAKGEKPAQLKVGDRIRIRITITADRDYDFVQVLDKRAACLEPVRQLSGWHYGSYCTPKDYSTNYYFDCLSKGQHVIENEYFIDRSGTYETGICVVECAYAPEFRGLTKSQTLIIK